MVSLAHQGDLAIHSWVGVENMFARHLHDSIQDHESPRRRRHPLLCVQGIRHAVNDEIHKSSGHNVNKISTTPRVQQPHLRLNLLTVMNMTVNLGAAGVTRVAVHKALEQVDVGEVCVQANLGVMLTELPELLEQQHVRACVGQCTDIGGRGQGMVQWRSELRSLRTIVGRRRSDPSNPALLAAHVLPE